MKALLAASLCAYTYISSSSLNLNQTFPELPAKMTLSDELNEEMVEIEPGTFNQITAETLAQILDEKKSASAIISDVKKGGVRGFKALLEGLRLSGIGITHPTTSLAPMASRDLGLSFPFWYLQFVSRADALEATLSLNDLAQALAVFYNNTPASLIEKSLLEDLQAMASSPNEGTRFFISTVSGLVQMEEGTEYLSFMVADPKVAEDLKYIKFSSLQLALLGLRLEAELKVKYGMNGVKKSSRSVSADLCDSTRDVVKNPEIIKKDPAFSRIIKITEADNSDSPANAKKSLDRMTNFIKTHSGVLKSLTARMSHKLVGGGALTRTKTKVAGEKKMEEISFTPRIIPSDESRCLTSLAQSAGVLLNANAGADFMKDRPIKLTIQKTYDKARVSYDYGNNLYLATINGKIDDKGFFRAPVIGLPQTKVLTAKAKSIIIRVPIKLETQIEIGNFMRADPARDEGVVVDALLALMKLNEKNKTRTTYTYIAVKDWVEEAEGSLSVAVTANYSHTSSQSATDRQTSLTISANHNSRMWINLEGNSIYNPGWPANIPLPPGIPEEVTRPSLSIMDKGNFHLKTDFKKITTDKYECDVCRPEDGFANMNIEYKDLRKASAKNVETTFLIIGPIAFDRVNKKISAQMVYSIVKTNAKWSKEFKGRQCPGSEPEESGSGTYEMDNQIEKAFEIEAKYEEVDGVVIVKKSFEVDFGYSLSPRSSDEIKIPAKLMVGFDLRVPLP